MPNWETFRVKPDSIHDEWNGSEEIVKAAEQVNGWVILPVVKELGYAGCRIVEALRPIGAGDDDEAAKRLQFQDAELDCYRARRGAIDAATAEMAIELESLYRNSAVIGTVGTGGHLVRSRFPADIAPRGNVRAGTPARPGPAFGGVSISVQTLRRRPPEGGARVTG